MGTKNRFFLTDSTRQPVQERSFRLGHERRGEDERQSGRQDDAEERAHRGEHGGNRRVVALHVREFVGDNRLEFVVVGAQRRTVPSVTAIIARLWLRPGGEGVGDRNGGDIHCRH